MVDNQDTSKTASGEPTVAERTAKLKENNEKKNGEGSGTGEVQDSQEEKTTSPQDSTVELSATGEVSRQPKLPDAPAVVVEAPKKKKDRLPPTKGKVVMSFEGARLVGTKVEGFVPVGAFQAGARIAVREVLVSHQTSRKAMMAKKAADRKRRDKDAGER